MNRLLLIFLFSFGQLIYAQNKQEINQTDFNQDQINFDEKVFDFDHSSRVMPENQGFLVILEPFRRTLLFAEVSSPVEKINKRMGDSFKQGEVLIKLEDVVFKSNYEKAKGLLIKHQAALEAKKELYQDRIASLFELREAEADLATARADLSLARKNLKASVIKAPYDGKVVELSIEEHELPRPGKELIETVADHILLARFLIPSSELKNIYIDKPIYITLVNYDKEIVAKVFRIGSVIDPSSSLIKVEAMIDNKDGNLRTGMTGTAYLIPKEERERIQTPPPPPMPLPPQEDLLTPKLQVNEIKAPKNEVKHNSREMNPYDRY